MTRYDVKIEPMPDNPVREERALGRNSGLYMLELWERIVTSPKNFQFVKILKENLTHEEAMQQQFELVNSLNGITV